VTADISADWSEEDWEQAREDLAPLDATDQHISAPQAGQHHNGTPVGWQWGDPDSRPAAWRAFGEGR
jgi:hypothetical protein